MKSRFVGAVALSAAVIGLGAPLAYADQDSSITVSRDGGPFRSTVELPIISTDASTKDNPRGMTEIVPGDSLSGTVTVRNGGPTAGTIEVYLVDPRSESPNASDDAWLHGDVTVKSGDKSWSLAELQDKAVDLPGTDHKGVLVSSQPVEAGGTVPVSVAVDFPFSAESGNRAGHGAGSEYVKGAHEAHLDAFVRISGESPASPAPSTPAPSPSVVPSEPAPAPSTPAPAPAPSTPSVVSQFLPRTGAEIAMYVLAGSVLVGLGVAVTVAARRKGGSR